MENEQDKQNQEPNATQHAGILSQVDPMQEAVEKMHADILANAEITSTIKPPQINEIPPVVRETTSQQEIAASDKTGGTTGLVEPIADPIKDGGITVRDQKTGQFLPGNPGGPGKPKGKHMTSLLREHLKTMARTKDGKMISLDQAIIRKLTEKAINGNDKSIEMVLDRIDGKPKESLDVNVVNVSEEAKAKADALIDEFLTGNQPKL